MPGPTVIDGSFEWWMRQVDAKVLEISGLDSGDLKDFAFRARFDAGEDPESVAVDLLEEEGFPFPG